MLCNIIYDLFGVYLFKLSNNVSQVQKVCLDRWGDLHNELQGAAFCLDPEYQTWDHASNAEAYGDLLCFCEKTFGAYKEGEAGEVGTDKAALAIAQYAQYKAGEGIFANKTVLASAKKMPGAAWWSQNGGNIKELWHVAMRALSQPTSAGAGERNWSTHSFIHSKLRNRLTVERGRKLVYVHYNLRAVKKVKKVDYVAEFFEWDPSDIESSGGEGGGDDNEVE